MWQFFLNFSFLQLFAVFFGENGDEEAVCQRPGQWPYEETQRRSTEENTSISSEKYIWNTCGVAKKASPSKAGNLQFVLLLFL